jgi:hypothetical protein
LCSYCSIAITIFMHRNFVWLEYCTTIIKITYDEYVKILSCVVILHFI